jgi:hypothetical protein
MNITSHRPGIHYNGAVLTGYDAIIHGEARLA